MNWSLLGLVMAGGALGAAGRHLIGGWMLRHACVDAAGWPEHQFVTVDVSGQQLTEDLLLVVHEALVVSGLRGERLWLELGENMLFGESSRTRSLLRRTFPGKIPSGSLSRGTDVPLSPPRGVCFFGTLLATTP